jgi:hypothetical protein
MHQYWPIFFLLVVLKVPVLAMIYLVWWASQPVPDVESGDDPGGDYGRRRRRPKFPHGPRRGPNGPDLRHLPEAPHEGRRRQADRTRSRDARLRDSSRSRETERK